MYRDVDLFLPSPSPGKRIWLFGSSRKASSFRKSLGCLPYLKLLFENCWFQKFSGIGGNFSVSFSAFCVAMRYSNAGKFGFMMGLPAPAQASNPPAIDLTFR
jgi:hypothetical protein